MASEGWPPPLASAVVPRGWLPFPKIVRRRDLDRLRNVSLKAVPSLQVAVTLFAVAVGAGCDGAAGEGVAAAVPHRNGARHAGPYRRAWRERKCARRRRVVLLEAHGRLEAGEISRKAFAKIERALLARIREVKGQRQQAISMPFDDDTSRVEIETWDSE